MEILQRRDSNMFVSLYTLRSNEQVDREEVSLIVGCSAWNQRFQERVYLQRGKEQTNKSATPDYIVTFNF